MPLEKQVPRNFLDFNEQFLNVWYSSTKHKIITRLDGLNCMPDQKNTFPKLLSPSNHKVSLEKAYQTPWKRHHCSSPLCDLDFKIIQVLDFFASISLFIPFYIMHVCMIAFLLKEKATNLWNK